MVAPANNPRIPEARGTELRVIVGYMVKAAWTPNITVYRRW